jgi:hypothetical protein
VLVDGVGGGDSGPDGARSHCREKTLDQLAAS